MRRIARMSSLRRHQPPRNLYIADSAPPTERTAPPSALAIRSRAFSRDYPLIVGSQPRTSGLAAQVMHRRNNLKTCATAALVLRTPTSRACALQNGIALLNPFAIPLRNHAHWLRPRLNRCARHRRSDSAVGIVGGTLHMCGSPCQQQCGFSRRRLVRDVHHAAPLAIRIATPD
jgi:hypothetical protein